MSPNDAGRVPIMHHLVSHAESRPDAPALHRHVDGSWIALTWSEYRTAVDDVAAALIADGVDRGDRIAILSGNRVEWHVADLAVLSAGAVTVPCYPTSSSSQIVHLLGHSGSTIAFVEDAAQLAKVLLHWHELPQLRRIVVFAGTEGLDTDRRVLAMDDLVTEGSEARLAEPARLATRRDGVSLDDLATIVYTSGTTGLPKGTMLTHRNLAATIAAVRDAVPTTPDDRFLSFLPVSHIAERMVSHIGQVVCGGQTWFARSLADVGEDLTTCRPTVFFAVPRVWEKFREAIIDEVGAKPAPVRAIAGRYLRSAQAAMDGEAIGSRTERITAWALDRSVGRTLRRGLGLDQARVVVSSAAPIHPDLLRWFAAIGVPIAEAWGQTEDCGPATLNPPDRIRIGTVGIALPGIEIAADDDGEILVRSETVCAGYWENPEATRALIDDDGWLHSGDLGSIDEDGYLTITGRKKDLIVTSSGKNIAPAAIEARLEQEPLIAKAIVVGEAQPYLTALLSVDIVAFASRTGTPADAPTAETLVDDPSLHHEIAQAIDRVNAAHARIEGIKTWRLLPYEFTVFGGELTPTLKVKRQVVIDRHRDLIDEMYDSGRTR